MTSKVVYVLSGFSPDKLRFFNQRSNKKIRSVLMNSKDDKANVRNLNWLCDNKVLEYNKDAKILVINEKQLEYISQSEKLTAWFKTYRNQFLTNDFDFEDQTDISALSNKLTIAKYLLSKKPEIMTHVRIMTGKQYNSFDNETKANLVVKSLYGSGNEGALLGPESIDENSTFLIEKVIKSTKHIKFYVCTTLVTPSKNDIEISMLSTSEDHSEFVNTGYPHTRADLSHYYELKQFMYNLAKIFGVTYGVFETELVYDDFNKKFYLIDLNPRWSTDHACVNEKFGEIVGKKFDMLYNYYNKIPFSKTVEKFLKKHPNYIGNMKYYASVFVDMKIENINL